MGGARLRGGGARRPPDPGPVLCVPVSTGSPLLVSPSFHFPRGPRISAPPEPRVPGGDDRPRAQILVFFSSGDSGSVRTRDPPYTIHLYRVPPSTFAGSRREPDRRQVYRGLSRAKGSWGAGGGGRVAHRIPEQNCAGKGEEEGGAGSDVMD